MGSIPTGGNFIFLRHLNANFVQKCQKCHICVINETSVEAIFEVNAEVDVHCKVFLHTDRNRISTSMWSMYILMIHNIAVHCESLRFYLILS